MGWTKQSCVNWHKGTQSRGGCYGWMNDWKRLAIMWLTILRNLQDVAYEGTVAIKRLGPGKVNGSFLRCAQHRCRVLWGMGQLPAGNIRTTSINKIISPITANPHGQRVTEHFGLWTFLVQIWSKAECFITERSVRQVMKCGKKRQQRWFLVKMDTQANKTRSISPEGGNRLKGIRRQIGRKCTDKDMNKWGQSWGSLIHSAINSDKHRQIGR